MYSKWNGSEKNQKERGPPSKLGSPAFCAAFRCGPCATFQKGVRRGSETEGYLNMPSAVLSGKSA
eukprot:2168960-Pyramimonas_sp.AAC.1